MFRSCGLDDARGGDAADVDAAGLTVVVMADATRTY